MGLPLSRNTNYAPSAPVLSADLNALQDAVVGGLKGLSTLIVMGCAFQSRTPGTTPPQYNVNGLDGSILTIAGTANDFFYAPQLDARATIVNVRLKVRDFAANTWQAHVYKVANVGLVSATVTEPVAAISSLANATDQTLTFNAVNIPLAGGNGCYIRVQQVAGTAAIRIYSAEIDYFVS